MAKLRVTTFFVLGFRPIVVRYYSCIAFAFSLFAFMFFILEPTRDLLFEDGISFAFFMRLMRFLKKVFIPRLPLLVFCISITCLYISRKPRVPFTNYKFWIFCSAFWRNYAFWSIVCFYLFYYILCWFLLKQLAPKTRT